jgi:hypothetical protein
MRVKIKKKRFLLVSLLMLVLIILTTIFTVYLLRVGAPYKKLLAHCVEVNFEGEVVQECKVFLNDFYPSGESEVCMKIVLPVLEISERDVEICVDNNIVQWENPYDEYIDNIPVVMEVAFSPSLFNKYNPNNISIELMEEAEAQSLVSSINNNTEKFITYITEASNDRIKKGYVLHESTCLDGENLCTVITVFYNEILDISTDSENWEDAELILKLKMNLEGKEIEGTVRGKEFDYLEYDYGYSVPKREEVFNANTYLGDYLNDKESIQVTCYIDGHQEFTESLIEDYIKGEIELDFIFKEIVYVYK